MDFDDKPLAWFLFILCFVVACCAAADALNRLTERTEMIVAETSLGSNSYLTMPGDEGEKRDLQSMDLWFDSVNFEKQATGSVLAGKNDDAIKEMDSAIQSIEKIKEDNPEFRKQHINYRIEELEKKRDLWKSRIRAGKSPTVSADEEEEAQPSIDEPQDASPEELVSTEAPTIGTSSALEVPEIGTGELATTTTPGFIKWSGNDSQDDDLLNDNLPSPPTAIKGALLPSLGSDLLAGSAASIRSAFQKEESTTTEVTAPAPDPTMTPDIEIMNSDPSSIWYRAFSATRDARRLEASGKIKAARDKYHEAKTCYDILNNEFPEFDSDHIKNGSEMLAAKITKLSIL